MSEIVYLNGSLIPLEQARISVLDYGFLYGYGLFETMRAYEGQVFRLDDHLNRLASSAEVLKILVRVADLKDAVMATIEANHLCNARIRIAVSIGEGSMVPDPATCRQPTVVILAGEYHSYHEQVYRQGFRAVVSSIRRNSQSPISRLKSANYLESMLARHEAREAGVDEALCLNEKGLLAEASMGNIFLVDGSILRTPGEESGILPGVTRGVVLELASHLDISLDISTVEHDISLSELYLSQEAFLTNSLIEVMPLTEVDGRLIGTGQPGPVTRWLMTSYRKLVLASMTSER